MRNRKSNIIHRSDNLLEYRCFAGPGRSRDYEDVAIDHGTFITLRLKYSAEQLQEQTAVLWFQVVPKKE